MRTLNLPEKFTTKEDSYQEHYSSYSKYTSDFNNATLKKTSHFENEYEIQAELTALASHKKQLEIVMAKWYLKIGWSLIPIIPNTKKPPIKWRQFQKRQPTTAEVLSWIDRGWHLAVVTGPISKILIVDDDRVKHGLPEWGFTSSIISKSQNNGKHYYFIYNREIHSYNNHNLHIDIKGWHSYCLGYSLHLPA